MSYESESGRRPLIVTIVAIVFMAAGVFGFIYHASEFFAGAHSVLNTIWVLLLRILAVVLGIFLLRGANWARWFGLAWIAYHAVLSMFHSTSEMITHFVLLVVIAVLLFIPKSSEYFHNTNTADKKQ